VELPGRRILSGLAEDIDSEGRLLVREPGASSPVPISAGDVIHVR
jgi:BirA family transcriptional regulator, biotin operon repressor / biotin---[acetyl-CoA-carboxylase] ligase